MGLVRVELRRLNKMIEGDENGDVWVGKRAMMEAVRWGGG